MKSSKRNLILKIFGYLFISVILISCQNSSESNEDNTFSEYTNISISINKFERTIMPETISLTNLSFKLYGAKSGEHQEVLKTWNNSNSITSSSITIKSGIWNFTMNAYSAGKLVLTSSKENVFLQGASNSLLFVLDEPNDMLGSVDVTFEFPAATGNIPGAKKIVVKLIKDSAEETEVNSQILIPENVTNDNTKQFVRYQNLNVEQGYYFLRFYIYQIENADYTNFHSTYIRVEPGLESKGRENINSLDKHYKLVLNLNGGTWNNNVTIPTEFSRFETINLPVGNATFESSYWTDATLDGWYEMTEDGDLSEVPVITSLQSGTSGDKTLYAKWSIKCPEEEIQDAFNNFSKGRFDIKLTTFGKGELENGEWGCIYYGLNDSEKYVFLDYREAVYDGAWRADATIYSTSPRTNSPSIICLYLPATVLSIETYAFVSCEKLRTVYYDGPKADFQQIQCRRPGANYLMGVAIIGLGPQPFPHGTTIICNDGTLYVSGMISLP